MLVLNRYWQAINLRRPQGAFCQMSTYVDTAMDIAGQNLGAQVLLDLENHHNFAWKEKQVIEGVEREVIVHRKGATPGFVVRDKGNAELLNSASHGAGRTMSRRAANDKFNWKDVNRFLRNHGVTLISSGPDQVPMGYKNIREVMEAQRDLVTVLGQFDPKLVKMASVGERPED